MPYASEKLFQAVNSLATSTGSIQERLGYAFTNLHTLKPEDFDDPRQREQFRSLWAHVENAAARGDEGAMLAAARDMSDDEARDAARVIVELDGFYRPIA